MSLIRWMLESVWDTTTGIARDSAKAVHGEASIVATRAYDLAMRPSPEKQLEKLEDYKKAAASIKERHLQRKAVLDAKKAQDNDKQSEELQCWKQKINPLLEQVTKELHELTSAALPFLWRSRIAEKQAEKDALTSLTIASNMEELRAIARQKIQAFDTQDGHESRIGCLLKEVLNIQDNNLILRKT